MPARYEQDSLDRKRSTYYFSKKGPRALFIEREDEKAVEVVSKIPVYALNPI
jgi:hypothetical protein